MYTNPFNRTHCTIRQVIDKFLHMDSNKRRKSAVKRMNSNCSDTSYKSNSSSKSSSSTSSTSSNFSSQFNRAGKYIT